MQGDQVKYTTVITKSSGSGQVTQPFTFENVVPGEYTLVINKLAHTTFTVINIIVGDDDIDLTQDNRKAVQIMTLRCGDIGSDGLINDSDLTILWMLANYNRKSSDAENQLCDLNGDGMINDMDLTILWLVYNYNQGAIVI